MQKMELGQKMHGFVVTEIRDVAEINAEMIRMTYEKNGAELIWLARPDDNKTFGIAFKTLPFDHTGVFHILEHSVLCGSKKYPIKEPYVALLQSSLQTFLNAMTYPDKTVYPVSSRNDKDFLNLMDVYLDAVLHPLAIEDPHAYRQEGWHYELSEPDGELICNGVVYNEMKGSFASRDELVDYELKRMLFPDNCYGFESGGHPEYISDLTYESFVASHQKYYHPSNSKIFLDGDMDIDSVLARIDEYLADFDMLEIDSNIPMQSPVTDSYETYYEVSEDSEDEALLACGWVYGDFNDREKTFALDVITEVIAGSNEAPLTNALLDAGLIADMSIQPLDGIEQPFLIAGLRDVPEDRRDEVWPLFEKTIKEICENGLDHKRLHASLNRLEFLTREKDYGATPRGLVYGLTLLDTWLYGGDPLKNIIIGDTFDNLRKKIDEGWYEKLLADTILNNPHNAKVTLLPSKTLGEEKVAKERERMAKIKASWSDEEIKKAIEEFAAFRQKQEEENSEEDMATLPKLELSDVRREITEVPWELKEVDGIKVIHSKVDTDGIVYLNAYFDLSDFSVRELQDARIIGKLLGDIATENYDVIGLLAEIDTHLGRLESGISIKSKIEELDSARPYINVTASFLESKKSEVARILNEVLFKSKFTDVEFISNEIKQGRMGMEEATLSSGNSFARKRIEASSSVNATLDEAISGIELLRYLQKLEKSIDKSYCEGLQKLYASLFQKSRMIIGVTGPLDEDWLREIIGIMGDEPMGEIQKYEKSSRPHAEGFKIPAQISFAAKGGNIIPKGGSYSGSDSVVANIISYGYLWNTIRVKGGAYGTGLKMLPTGAIGFGSYRDPSGDKSLDLYDKASDALRELAASDENIDGYIISTIGSQEPIISPRYEGLKVINEYFAGSTSEYKQRVRDEILGTTKEDLLKAADKIDAITKDAEICIIGGAEIVDACGELLDSVENI